MFNLRMIKKITIHTEKDVRFNLNDSIKMLNYICSSIKFESGNKKININNYFIDAEIIKDLSNSNHINEKKSLNIVLTNKPYYNNYFYEESHDIIVISLYGWNLLTDLSIENGLIYFLSNILAQEIKGYNDKKYHDTGCIYDFLWDKSKIDISMRQAYICRDCFLNINELKLSKYQKTLLNNLKELLNYLSSSSKWNENVIDYWKNTNKSNIANLKGEKISLIKKNEINVMIASPTDAALERKCLIENLERKFRNDGHEKMCKKRLIVQGWEDLASQTGHAQDIINKKITEKVDIIIAIFKHSLGSPVYKKNKKRSISGTVEEILFSLNENGPLGMLYFYSVAPNPSFGSKDYNDIKKKWDDLTKFKNSIREKVLFKPFNSSEDLLNTVNTDLSSNIRDHFS